jgi:hypothetical protein
MIEKDHLEPLQASSKGGIAILAKMRTNARPLA